jgi:hypothetical protein
VDKARTTQKAGVASKRTKKKTEETVEEEEGQTEREIFRREEERNRNARLLQKALRPGTLSHVLLGVGPLGN